MTWTQLFNNEEQEKDQALIQGGGGAHWNVPPHEKFPPRNRKHVIELVTTVNPETFAV